VRDEATLVRDEHGNPLYWLGVQYDITEQKRTEEELRRSEERFRATFEQAAVGIVQVGLDGEWLRVNDKFCNIIGYEREELEAVSVFHLISPEDSEKDLDVGVRMLAGEFRDYTEEKLIVGKEGKRVWINLTVSLVHDDSDEPRYFIAVAEDIGKRKQAEEDLRLRDRAVAASSNGIVITDPNLPDNPIVYVNPAFERITGYTASEALGRNCRFMQGEEDRNQPALTELREALREGRYSRVVLRNRRKDATPFWNELSVSPVRDEAGRLTHFVGVQNDVTERQRTQEELRQSEERFKVLAQEVVEGIILIEDGKIIDANRSLTEMFGYDLEELVGRDAIELTLPENREMVRHRISDEDTRVYESEGLKKDGTIFPIEIRPRHLPYSGRRIRVTSVIDLTERKRAEDAVRESEKRFRALVQNASDIILVLDAEGTVLYESPAVERVLGYSPEERVGINAFDQIHPDDRAMILRVFSENLSSPGPFPPVEYRVRDREGTWRHLEAIGENLLHDPVIKGVVVNSRDVTERKRTEKTLKESERRFRQLFENSSDALFIHDERGRFVDCNAEACRALGYTREELLALSVADVTTRLISEEERREGGTLWELALQGEPGRIIGFDDNELRRKDGTTFPVEVGVGAIEHEDRRMIFASARDITERKRAEEALKRSEARLQAILDNTTAVVYVKDDEGRYSLINRRFEELFHVTLDQVRGKTDHELFPKEVADEFRTNDEEVLRSGIPLEAEEVVPQEDRMHTYFSVKVPLRDQDGITYAVCGISTDITERKRAEEALLISEERYRAVVEQSAEGIYLLDAGTRRILETNPALRAMLGYSAAELRGMELYDISAHSREDVETNLERTLAERARFVGERKYLRKDGSLVEVEVGVSVISYSGMEVICAVLRDITERKRAEARYRTLVEQLPAVTYMQEIETAALAYVSPQIEGVLGYSPEEYLENPNLRSQTIHPEDREWVLEEDARTDETGEPYSVEYRRIARDGRVLWVREEAMLVRDSEGGPLFWQGILMDVTERKHQEEALRQSEALYRTVVEQAAENIFLVDAKTRRVLEANDALYRSLGYTAEELKEMTLYDIVAHDQESVDINIERIMEDGDHSLGERQYRRKDGSLADVEVNVSAVPYDGGEAMCIVAHDVTERKQAERALEEIREAERNRIARELHDSTLQDIVYALQEVQVMQVMAGDEMNPALEDIAEALRRSVEGLRGAIFELRLKETLNQSLASSLENLVDLNRRMARGRYELELIVEDDFPARLPDRTGQELTRLVQEALTNVRRHAEASRVRVELGLDDEVAYVEISDDGRGFDATNARTGIGRQSMSQRALGLGGDLIVESAPGEGTRVRFLIPVSRLVEE